VIYLQPTVVQSTFDIEKRENIFGVKNF